MNKVTFIKTNAEGYSSTLSHHGVKGMKWGIRKVRRVLGFRRRRLTGFGRNVYSRARTAAGRAGGIARTASGRAGGIARTARNRAIRVGDRALQKAAIGGYRARQLGKYVGGKASKYGRSAASSAGKYGRSAVGSISKHGSKIISSASKTRDVAAKALMTKRGRLAAGAVGAGMLLYGGVKTAKGVKNYVDLRNKNKKKKR